jgi:Galactose oxidase, central domain
MGNGVPLRWLGTVPKGSLIKSRDSPAELTVLNPPHFQKVLFHTFITRPEIHDPVPKLRGGPATIFPARAPSRRWEIRASHDSRGPAISWTLCLLVSAIVAGSTFVIGSASHTTGPRGAVPDASRWLPTPTARCAPLPVAEENANSTQPGEGGSPSPLAATPPCTALDGRAGAAMTYDAADHYTLLFGDGGAIRGSGDTCKYVNANWSCSILPHSPSYRTDASMVYDAQDGYVLLFGGVNATGVPLSDSWKFAGGHWTRLTPTVHPSARSGASMTYDAVDHYVVLFGGGSNTNVLGDTWKFAGGAWSQIHPTSHPSARADSGFAFDAADGYAVLFGGVALGANSSLVFLGDSWNFSAGNWTLMHPARHPSARAGTAMAFDGKNDYIALFGGGNSITTDFGDTWKFVGGAWTQLSPGVAPSARNSAAFAPINATGSLVLVGGGNFSTVFGDTWDSRAGSGFTYTAHTFLSVAYSRFLARLSPHRADSRTTP